MSDPVYYISSERNRWLFEIDGEVFGPYSTPRDAIAAARDDAHQRFAPDSAPPRILMRTSTGGWRTAGPEDSMAAAGRKRSRS